MLGVDDQGDIHAVGEDRALADDGVLVGQIVFCLGCTGVESVGQLFGYHNSGVFVCGLNQYDLLGGDTIGTGDRVLMMENAIYSVIAPESCASILWRDNKFKADAATAMKLTAKDMADLNVIDEVIPEPAGGAHTDWQTTMELLANSVAKHITELQAIPVDELPSRRADKFLSMTRDVEIYQPEHIGEEH